MKEHNRYRLALIDARFGRPTTQASDGEAFDDAFLRVSQEVIRPVMEEVASELEKLGHAPRIEMGKLKHENAWISPAIGLYVGMRGRDSFSGFVAFGVLRWSAVPEVLAWLVVPPTPFDLLRYAHPREIQTDHVEQLLIDATEHLFAHAKS
jgi:hypothetical protein